jgi:hypothetical protein
MLQRIGAGVKTWRNMEQSGENPKSTARVRVPNGTKTKESGPKTAKTNTARQPSVNPYEMTGLGLSGLMPSSAMALSSMHFSSWPSV